MRFQVNDRAGRVVLTPGVRWKAAGRSVGLSCRSLRNSTLPPDFTHC